MSLEQNKAIVRSYFERAINQRDLAWLDQIIAPSFAAGAGPDHARHVVQHYLLAFPDIHYTVEDLTAEAERVAVHVSFRGTHQGEFLGVPATGRRISGSGAELALLSEGKIVAAGWQYHDQLDLLRQFGVWPPAARHA
jgi:predicted ester cyclase